MSDLHGEIRLWRYEVAEEKQAARRVLLEEQEGRCAICFEEKRLVVDHCHHRGYIRGLLCNRCNTGIGALGDSYYELKAALRYLERYEAAVNPCFPL